MRSIAPAVLLSCALASTALAASSNVPRELLKFAQKQWVVEKFAYGNLNGNAKDVAMFTALHPEGAFGGAEDRKVVVAYRQPNGELKEVAESRGAAPVGAGPAGGDPDISIKRNSVFISQFGGSREKGTDTYQYKNVNGVWRLIGVESEWYDSLYEGIPTSTTSVNFLTNTVDAKLTTDNKLTKRASFYEIYSVKGTPPVSGAWKAPPLVLNKKQSVDKGQAAWKGAQDLSATVQSMHDKNKLYFRVAVRDNSVLPEDNIELIDDEQKVIPVLSRERKQTSEGYEEVLQYDMNKSPLGAANTERNESSFVPFTLRITDTDKDAPAIKTLTTAISASGTPKFGGLLLLPSDTMPNFSNVMIREGIVHGNVFDFPG